MQISNPGSDSPSMGAMATPASVIIGRYQQLYRKLYLQEPHELRDLGTGWVVVNGVRMRVAELERLTEQMQSQYRQTVTQKRSIVKRIVAWLHSH